jgi:hypothetical protein
MSLYTLLVSALPKAAAVLTVKFAITPFVITISAAASRAPSLARGQTIGKARSHFRFWFRSPSYSGGRISEAGPDPYD